MVEGGTSAIYEGRIGHHRLAPRVHRFQYRVFYLWLDLDELDDLDRSLRWFGRNRRNLFAFCDRDHFEDDDRPAREKLLGWLAAEGFDPGPVARVRLLTLPRVLGYIFNPVCFFFCFDASGAPLCAVAEVTNTFHEKKAYLLRERDGSGRFRLVAPKHFYVSPFSRLDLAFDFHLRTPDSRMEIRIDDRDGPDLVLRSILTGRRRPLTDRNLLRCALLYPLLTLRVILLIHWHAFRLWRKKLPWHRKSDQPQLQTGIHRRNPASDPGPQAH